MSERHRYDEIAAKAAKAVLPPRQDAKFWHPGDRKGKPHPRDENLRHIRKHGRKRWKQDSGHHRRSIAETTTFRLKTIFGGNFSACQFDNQRVEFFIKCAALNRMIQIATKLKLNTRIAPKASLMVLLIMQQSPRNVKLAPARRNSRARPI